jgi:hypothetical protein
VIADEGLHLPETALERERLEVLVAIDLVAAGGARRVLVGGLEHGAELVTRLGPQATMAGVLLCRSPADGLVSGVLVRPRPSVLG